MGVPNKIMKPFLTQKNGVWQIVHRDPITNKNKWKSTGTKDKELAEKIFAESLAMKQFVAEQKQGLQEMVIERARSFAGVAMKTQTTFSQAWEVYLADEHTQAMKKSSLAAVHTHYLVFTTWSSSEKNISSVEKVSYELAVEFFQKFLKGKRGVADGTLINYKRVLSGIWSRIKRPLGLMENPFTDVRTPRHPQRQTHRCFTQEELKAVYAALPDDWKLMVRIAYHTGLRFGDCCCFDMKWLRGNILYPRPGKLQRYGQELCIPLPEDLVKDIQARHLLNGDGRYSIDNGLDETMLFPEFALKYSYHDGDFGKYFGNILNKLGFDSKNEQGILSFHSIRHTYNTMLAELGADSGTRMKLLGHSTLSINTLYNHAVDSLREVTSKIPKLED